uniref:Phosphoinositide phospholipase C, Ca2+-dependent n=1 Tax=Candidatus Kentrum sp. UNK TaxID=2126344 RepID=A0A451A8U3_9GAMM|nr:MAG: Phosphoinositide phospholipase C, Ca2+-dependent [Candidatus Kentron sp. UNK]VFK70507.1 MAG: Phosphoinositide phospholipase C, Ca2+-dependent [Candidatus Kentron sp. UNK]
MNNLLRLLPFPTIFEEAKYTDRPDTRVPTRVVAACLTILAAFALPSSAFAQKYNQAYRVASHNSYEGKYARRLTDVVNVTTAIEIDIYDNTYIHTNTNRFIPFVNQQLPLARKGGKPGYWYVRHDIKGDNYNNCAQSEKGLKGCLQDLIKWSKSHRNHEVITVFLDKKQGWGGKDGRGPADLDNLITSVIPKSKIFRPADLKGNYSSLRSAAQQGRWPDLSSLRSKFIFVLTGGMLIDHNKTHHQYVQKREGNAILFVAPDVDEKSDVTGTPNQFDSRTRDWVVFCNMKRDKASPGLTAMIANKGYITRVWGGDGKTATDNRTELKLMESFKVHFSAFYKYKLPATSTQVIAYEDRNGWNGRGAKWHVGKGSYSYKGRGGFSKLPFDNDEVRAVFVPRGLKVYMTDDDSFQPGRHGTITIKGPIWKNIDNRYGLAGKVSSIRVQDANARPQKRVTVYEDDNGWRGHGSKWHVTEGRYSYKGKGGNRKLPFPNDEIRAVDVPAGVTVEMTDKDSFKKGGKGTVRITGPARTNINSKKNGLAGKVSSIRVR